MTNGSKKSKKTWAPEELGKKYQIYVRNSIKKKHSL